MSPTWKIAVLVDPLTAVVSDSAHPLGLASQLAERGHCVRLFGPPLTALGFSPPRTTGGRAFEVGASVALFGPQVVVAYDALSPAAWLGARSARRSGAPLVLIEAAAWGGGRPAQRVLWRVGESLWGRYVRRTANCVLALEPHAAERSLRRGFSSEQVHALPHGVDLESHRPGRASEELARRRISGRVLSARTDYASPQAVEALIEGFAATVGQRDDWSLVVASDSAAPARVAKCAYRAGVGARTHFLSLNDEAFAPLLSSSTLFAALAEPGARAVWDVERALACGAPTLVLSGARGAHLVQHDVHGWTLERGDARSWATALAHAACAPQARRRWSQAARQFALERLGWGVLVRALEDAARARLDELAERDAASSRRAASA